MKNIIYKITNSISEYLTNQLKLIGKNKLFVHTAAISYYILFSLSPFLVLVVAFIPFTPLTKESIIFAINNMLPKTLASFGEGLIHEMYNLSGIILPISLIVILWSASLGVKSIREALSDIYSHQDHKNVIKIYGISMLYTLAFIVLLLIIVIFGVLGQPIYELISSSLPNIPGIIGQLLAFHNILTIIATFIMTTLCYIFLPPEKNKLRNQWVGIIFTVIVQFIFSKIFSWYLTLVNGYSMYGSLAIIVVMLFYVYWNIFILLLGAQINSYIKMRRNEKK